MRTPDQTGSIRSQHIVILLIVTAFAVRFVTASLAPHPGIADSNHYYNLARNLAEGRGFVIDYIWQYHIPPDHITHPVDYWMPLPALLPALSLKLAPGSLLAALLPSVLFSTLIVVLAACLVRVARLDNNLMIPAMGMVIFLPELLLNAARTDTTMPYVLFIGLCSLFFYKGLQQHPAYLLLAGLCAGLAHLSRQDAILMAPAMLLTGVIYWRWGSHPLPYRWLWLIPAGWLLMIAPWMLRNLHVHGFLLPSGSSRTLFMTSFIDQFTYGRTLDLQHYLDQGVVSLVSNLVIQAIANLRTLYEVLDNGLPLLAAAGILTMLQRRDRERLLLLALPLMMVLALFCFYSFVTPYHTQGGSFRKSYLLVIPFMALAAVYALAIYLQKRRYHLVISLLVAGMMLLNAISLIRQDFNRTAQFDQSIRALDPALQQAGDLTGDGRITVMTQDPFILNYHGYPALMIPSDPREMILEVAYRYEVDYILLPAARAALDPLYDAREEDDRLRWQQAPGNYQLLAVLPP